MIPLLLHISQAALSELQGCLLSQSRVAWSLSLWFPSLIMRSYILISFPQENDQKLSPRALGKHLQEVLCSQPICEKVDKLSSLSFVSYINSCKLF